MAADNLRGLATLRVERNRLSRLPANTGVMVNLLELVLDNNDLRFRNPKP